MIPRFFAALALALAAPLLRAQYVPPAPPAPVPGALDDWLHGLDAGLAGWDIGVNERVRVEDRLGAGTTHAGLSYDCFAAPPTANNNRYWLSRLMPRVGYQQAWFSFQFEARSSYSFGDDRYTATAPGKALADDDGPLQVQQGFVALGDPKAFPVSLKVGRQELVYGDQRLVGSALWLNVPHTFDAAKLRYQGGRFGVDVFTGGLVYPRAEGFERANPHDRLSGVYVDAPKLASASVFEAYLLARDVSRLGVTDNWSQVPAPFRFPAPQDVYTLGIHAKSKPDALGAWDYGFEGMGQFGNRTAVFPGTPVAAALAAPRLRQEAWAFIAQGGYTWKAAPAAPRLAVIVSAASGDRNSTDGRSETFQNLLPSNHGFYGVMDLTGLQNIEDYRLSLSVKPTSALHLAVDLHDQYLMTTSDYWYNAASVPRITPGATAGSGRGYGINPTYSPNVGQELDFVMGWKVCRALLVEAGVGQFFRGAYVRESLQAVGSKDARYGYAQTTLNL